MSVTPLICPIELWELLKKVAVVDQGVLYPPVHSSAPIIRQVLVRSHQSQFFPSHFQSPNRHRESMICDNDS